MAGRIGCERFTLKNKEVIGINENYILLSGPIPGANGELVAIYTK